MHRRDVAIRKTYKYRAIPHHFHNTLKHETTFSNQYPPYIRPLQQRADARLARFTCFLRRRRAALFFDRPKHPSNAHTECMQHTNARNKITPARRGAGRARADARLARLRVFFRRRRAALFFDRPKHPSNAHTECMQHTNARNKITPARRGAC